MSHLTVPSCSTIAKPAGNTSKLVRSWSTLKNEKYLTMSIIVAQNIRRGCNSGINCILPDSRNKGIMPICKQAHNCIIKCGLVFG